MAFFPFSSLSRYASFLAFSLVIFIVVVVVAFNFYLFVVYSFCFFRIICALFITAASTYYVTRDEQIILLIYNAIYSVVFLRRQFACFFVFAGGSAGSPR